MGPKRKLDHIAILYKLRHVACRRHVESKPEQCLPMHHLLSRMACPGARRRATRRAVGNATRAAVSLEVAGGAVRSLAAPRALWGPVWLVTDADATARRDGCTLCKGRQGVPVAEKSGLGLGYCVACAVAHVRGEGRVHGHAPDIVRGGLDRSVGAVTAHVRPSARRSVEATDAAIDQADQRTGMRVASTGAQGPSVYRPRLQAPGCTRHVDGSNTGRAEYLLHVHV